MDRVTEVAPAKINLGLKVLRRREDGYHDILSVFQTVDLEDRLEIESTGGSGIEILCDHPDIPTGKENLVFQAIEAMRSGVTASGVRVQLSKRIPAGAGLGGGSADAAAAIRGMRCLLGGAIPESQVARIANGLGADVPFLLEGGMALVEGRGGRINRVQAEGDFFLLLVHPGVPVSTRWAYQNLRIGLTQETDYTKFLDSVRESGRVSLSDLWGCLENDFLPLVVDSHPPVREALRALESTAPVTMSMTGTGSAVYAVFTDLDAAQSGFHELFRKGFQTTICRPTEQGTPTP